MKNFALTGVAGYIASRHLQAIKETNNELVAALDPHDSVGILDKYFNNVSFFTEFERFERHLEKLKRNGHPEIIDYLSICSPNHLHDAHIRLGLRLGADAICEKPLVLNPWNLDALAELEAEYKRKVYTILQLRLHPSLLKIKQKFEQEKKKSKYEIILTYITRRGKWYSYSWKGDEQKSGGVISNIGIHFFDILIWLFGGVQKSDLYISGPEKASGFLSLKLANVRWFLSVDGNDLPKESILNNQSVFRLLKIDDEIIDLSENFTSLHTEIYNKILSGKGFGIEDARKSIECVYELRKKNINNKIEYPHPLLIKE